MTDDMLRWQTEQFVARDAMRCDAMRCDAMRASASADGVLPAK